MLMANAYFLFCPKRSYIWPFSLSIQLDRLNCMFSYFTYSYLDPFFFKAHPKKLF